MGQGNPFIFGERKLVDRKLLGENKTLKITKRERIVEILTVLEIRL